MLGNRAGKSMVDLSELVLQNLAEAHQNRQRNPPQLQLVDQFFQIHAARRILGGVNPQMTVVPNGKISLAPARDVVQFAASTVVHRSVGSQVGAVSVTLRSTRSSSRPVSQEPSVSDETPLGASRKL